MKQLSSEIPATAYVVSGVFNRGLSDEKLTGIAISGARARQYFLPIPRPAGLELPLLDIRFWSQARPGPDIAFRPHNLSG